MNPLQRLCRRLALGQRLEQRRAHLHSLARSWCRDRALADDLVQETFARALHNMNQLREPQAIDAWLFHILYNCWCDYRRRERPSEDIDALADAPELAVDPLQETDDLCRRVRAEIARLPDGQREVLTLVDLAGFSYGEVATILNIPTGTVTSRVSRAREALRTSLAALVSESEKVVAIRSMGK